MGSATSQPLKKQSPAKRKRSQILEPDNERHSPSPDDGTISSYHEYSGSGQLSSGLSSPAMRDSETSPDVKPRPDFIKIRGSLIVLMSRDSGLLDICVSIRKKDPFISEYTNRLSKAGFTNKRSLEWPDRYMFYGTADIRSIQQISKMPDVMDIGTSQ